jgi:hypothetical protein
VEEDKRWYQFDWINWLISAMFAVIVIIGGAAILRIILTPDKTYHGRVVDKQVIATGYGTADLIVSAAVGDHKQTFLARNSVIYASISTGDTCDLVTYQGSQGVIVIREARCNTDPR